MRISSGILVKVALAAFLDEYEKTAMLPGSTAAPMPAPSLPGVTPGMMGAPAQGMQPPPNPRQPMTPIPERRPVQAADTQETSELAPQIARLFA